MGDNFITILILINTGSDRNDENTIATNILLVGGTGGSYFCPPPVKNINKYKSDVWSGLFYLQWNGSANMLKMVMYER